MSLGTNATLTTAQNFTLENPTNLTSGMMGNLTVTQPAGNHYSITWGSVYRFPGGTKFALSTSNAAIDEILWYSPDGTNVDIISTAKKMS